MLSYPLRQDAAIFLRDSEDLFLAKIKYVVLAGGIGGIHRTHAQDQKGNARRRSSLGNALVLNKVETEAPLTPDNSKIIQLDIKAAEFFYVRCQELGIQLIMVPHELVGAVSIPSSFYDALAESGSPSALRIRGDKKEEIQAVWQQVCQLDATAQDGAFTSVAKDKQWFVKQYCDGRGLERGADDSIWDLITTMDAPHDPFALIACVPSLRGRFYKASDHYVEALRTAAGEGNQDDAIAVITKHLVVHDAGVRSERLRDYMLQTLQAGLSLEAASKQQHAAAPVVMITDGKNAAWRYAKGYLNCFHSED